MARTVRLVWPHVLREIGPATGDVYEITQRTQTEIPEEDLKPLLRRWAEQGRHRRPQVVVVDSDAPEAAVDNVEAEIIAPKYEAPAAEDYQEQEEQE